VIYLLAWLGFIGIMLLGYGFVYLLDVGPPWLPILCYAGLFFYLAFGNTEKTTLYKDDYWF